MNYQVKSGDCLWNIVQQNFGLKTEAEITSKINQIAKANNLSNPNLIFNGQTLNLGDDFKPVERQADGMRTEANAEATEEGRTDSSGDFNAWIEKGGKEGNQYVDFKMFDFNKQTYAEDLKKFAQENVIKKFDKDNDGKLSEEEFIAMETKGASDIPETYLKKFQEAFANLNLDDDKSHLTAEEIGTQFMVADYKNGKVDGKFSANDYIQAVQTNEANDIKQNFFNKFFKKA